MKRETIKVSNNCIVKSVKTGHPKGGDMIFSKTQELNSDGEVAREDFTVQHWNGDKGSTLWTTGFMKAV